MSPEPHHDELHRLRRTVAAQMAMIAVTRLRIEAQRANAAHVRQTGKRWAEEMTTSLIRARAIRPWWDWLSSP